MNAFNGTSIGKEGDRFVESFWYWKRFSSYIKALALMIFILFILTDLFGENMTFIALMGTASSFIEALLGVP